MRRVVIHVGFPKTGTTTLQRAVFPRLAGPRLGYLAISSDGAVRSDLSHLRWRREMVGLRPGWFRPRTSLEDLLHARHLVGSPTEALLISDEQLLVDPLLAALIERRGAADAIEAMFRRLRAFLPENLEVRLLLTIRRQEELLPAFVAQMAHRVPRARQRRLETAIEVLDRQGSALHAALAFDEVIDRAHRTLRPTSVTVLPLEQLASDVDRYLDGLHGAVGVDGEGSEALPALYSRRADEGTWVTSYGPASSLVHRAYANLPLPLPPEWAKRLGRFADTPRPRGGPPTIVMRAAHREHLRRSFTASNARLAAKTGLDLAGLGYATA